jgi:hypothetical protein
MSFPSRQGDSVQYINTYGKVSIPSQGTLRVAVQLFAGMWFVAWWIEHLKSHRAVRDWHRFDFSSPVETLEVTYKGLDSKSRHSLVCLGMALQRMLVSEILCCVWGTHALLSAECQMR